jgi:hypothetical protein
LLFRAINLWRFAFFRILHLITLAFYANCMLINGGKLLEDRVRTAVFDADQLETLMVAAFELMGKPEAQARELARAILKAAERPQSGDPGSPDRDPPRRLV